MMPIHVFLCIKDFLGIDGLFDLMVKRGV